MLRNKHNAIKCMHEKIFHYQAMKKILTATTLIYTNGI